MNAILDHGTMLEEHPTAIRTTLYDLIEAMHDKLEADDEKLIVGTVVHMLREGLITFPKGTSASVKAKPV